MSRTKTPTKKPATDTTDTPSEPRTTAKRPTPEEALIAMAWQPDNDLVHGTVLTDAMRMQCDLIWATRNSPDGDLHKAAVKARPGLVNAVLLAGGDTVPGLPTTCPQILGTDWS